MPTITSIKDLSIYTNKRLTDAEFGRMDKPERAFQGAMVMLFIPSIMIVGIAGFSMFQKPINNTSVSNKSVSKNRVDNASSETDLIDIPKTEDCGWEKC